MTGFGTHHIRDVNAARYATVDDFCQVFSEELDGLYQLSFLVAGDHGKAERCILAGLGECTRSAQVFREWTLSWAKRAIIRHAVRELRPQPHRDTASQTKTVLRSNASLSDIRRSYFNSEAVLALEDFERFVFVISVLEGYSNRDCAVLLGCSLLEVRQARTRATVYIGSRCIVNWSSGASTFTSESSSSLIALTDVPTGRWPTL